MERVKGIISVRRMIRPRARSRLCAIVNSDHHDKWNDSCSGRGCFRGSKEGRKRGACSDSLKCACSRTMADELHGNGGGGPIDWLNLPVSHTLSHPLTYNNWSRGRGWKNSLRPSAFNVFSGSVCWTIGRGRMKNSERWGEGLALRGDGRYNHY